MPLYSMSSFLMPKGWCEELDKILKYFLWGFPTQKSRNFTPKGWGSICLPKKQGGLGLQKMSETNRALITKLAWRVVTNPDNLWVHLVKLKYKCEGPMSIP